MLISTKYSRLFYKYLISYIIILLLPLTIMGSLVYSYFIEIIQQEVLNANLNNLDRTKDIIDNQLKQFSSISNQLFLNQNLGSFTFKTDPFNAISVINELKKYKATNDFFEEIFLYFHGDDYFYSSASSTTITRFFQNQYHYEKWDENTFFKDVNSIVIPSVRPVEKVKMFSDYTWQERYYVTFIYPLTFDGIHQNRTVIFLVPEESFCNLIKSTAKDFDDNTIILNSQNELIASLKDTDYMTSGNLSLMLSDQKKNLKTIVLQNKKYLFTFVKSPETGWKYISLVPVNKITAKVTSAKLIFIYVLIFILMTGAAIIYFIMKINYKPIQILKQYTEKIWPGRVQSANELDIVKGAIDYLNNQNTQLQGNLHDNIYAVKEYLLFCLLNGRISSLKDFNEKGSAIGLKFSKSIFQVVIFYINHLKNDTNQTSTNIIEMVEGTLPDIFEGYAKEQTDQNKIYMIIAADPDSDMKLGDSLLGMQTLINEKLGLSITLGVGNSYNKISQIPKSYMEATAAIDYRFVKGIDRVIYFSEITIHQSSPDIALHYVPDKLKLYIKQGNIEQIEIFLTNISNYFKLNNTPIFTARMVCFDIINAVIQTMDEINSENPLPKKDYPDAFMLSEFETVDELVSIVKKVSEDIILYLTNPKENINVSLIDRMLVYLRDNYTDCDFSIQQMANHFNMALSNLSSYFKDKTGFNLLDYETNLKIEKAKQLLCLSDMPLKDISMEVGYYNVTSFLRRFKQIVGSTPGEYRNKQKILQKK